MRRSTLRDAGSIENYMATLCRVTQQLTEIDEAVAVLSEFQNCVLSVGKHVYQ